ncbi:MAG: L,D-transpeptidase family protein [Magnetococcales bacterium]|nr:L,D-transpeptidase family protein [Magnetococcales bacterium]
MIKSWLIISLALLYTATVSVDEVYAGLKLDSTVKERRPLLPDSLTLKNSPPPEILTPRRFATTPDDELIGEKKIEHLVKANENLMELARVYGLGFNEIALANHGVDPWEPKPGTKLTVSSVRILPGLDEQADIIINIPEMRLYHRWQTGWIDTYAIGVGREGFATPTGDTSLVSKRALPSWYVPKSIRLEKPELPAVVLPGPENPLGSHALYLAMRGYLLHGTNQPFGIGRRVSHGCIRLYPEDVKTFFANAKIGSKVRLVHEPVKAGWRSDKLFIEVYPIFAEEVGANREAKLSALATSVVGKALERRPDLVVQVDWSEVDRFVNKPDGVPHQIGWVVSE